MKKSSALIISGILITLLLINLGSAGFNEEFQNTGFYKFIEPYFVPAGMSGISGLIIGVISLIILFSIFLDVFMILPFFSTRTNKIIAVGLAIIMILFKGNIAVAGWLFGIGSSLFGFAGTAAVLLTIFFAIAVLVAFFFGGNKITRWLIMQRINKENLDKVAEAEESGGDIAALRELAKTSTK